MVLAVIETLQRAKDSKWDEVAATHKVLRQLLLENNAEDVAILAVLVKALEVGRLVGMVDVGKRH